MKHNLINVEFNGSVLHVSDYTDYAPGFCNVEFVTYVKDGVSTISAKSKRIVHNHCQKPTFHFEPEVDGRYVYYHIVLPCYQMFDTCHKVEIPCGFFVGELTNGEKIICLNPENSVSLESNGSSAEIKIVEDWKDLIDTTKLTNEQRFSKEFFSIRKLNECVAKLQKRYILKHADDCGSLKCKKGSDPDKANRDFLFITAYLLDHLIAYNEFSQAEDLLDKIKSCGNTLCEDNNNSNGCNCNG